MATRRMHTGGPNDQRPGRASYISSAAKARRDSAYSAGLALGQFALIALCLMGCQPSFIPPPRLIATATASGPADDWTVLRRRPLHLPTLAAGATCPIEHARQVTAQYGPAIGRGPVYAAIGGDGVLAFAPPANFASTEWGGDKVLWFADPDVRGPVLIRGHQLDGTNELRFERGALPPAELTFIAAGYDPGGWTGVPSYTRVRAAGCYAYQIDGASFTEVIVFQAQAG